MNGYILKFQELILIVEDLVMKLMRCNKFWHREVKSTYCANKQGESWKYRREWLDFYSTGMLASWVYEFQLRFVCPPKTAISGKLCRSPPSSQPGDRVSSWSPAISYCNLVQLKFKLIFQGVCASQNVKMLGTWDPGSLFSCPEQL